VITLDTSGVVALLNARDPNHESATGTLLAARPPWLVPATIMAEIAYMLESRGHRRLLDDFLQSVEAGQVVVDCEGADLSRVRGLIARYADLPLGYADASVIACAERNGGNALTFDDRHFGTVAREGSIASVPEQR
jgi:predicted nucleic acid-binding protein